MRHSARLEAKGVSNLSAAIALDTPTSLSPRRANTPPTEYANIRDVSVNTLLDPNALSAALNESDVLNRQRERTPGESPTRKRHKTYGDRFIPTRSNQNLYDAYNLHQQDNAPPTPSRPKSKTPASELHIQKTEEADRTYTNVLRAEMFDQEVPCDMQFDSGVARNGTPPSNQRRVFPTSLTPSTPHKSFLNYSSPAHCTPSLTPKSRSRSERGPNLNTRAEIYSLSPIKYSSQKMLLSPRKTPRAVSKVPYKVLDAPNLADDFYLNLVDWGSANVLAVGLGSSIYLWNSETGKVDELAKLENDTVTSVSWIQRGSHLAVGTAKGFVMVWDTQESRRLRTMTGHSARVSSMSWNQHILSTGSRDRSILHRDVRSPGQSFRRLVGHKQEVCGLRWNAETNQLASGGNDNKIFVWDGLNEGWLHRWGETEGGHKAAVKAIAWSPHQRGLLASGGGTADRCIKFWNTVSTSQNAANAALVNSNTANRSSALALPNLTNIDSAADVLGTSSDPLLANPNLLCSHDTGSQVCNLTFSVLTSELVSTHGYSQNAISIWKYPSMSQVVSLTGHTYRVLYLAMSPSGDTIVTGAGDETLRFWDVFSAKAKERERGRDNGGLVREWGTIR